MAGRVGVCIVLAAFGVVRVAGGFAIARGLLDRFGSDGEGEKLGRSCRARGGRVRRNRGIQRSLLPRGSNDSADVMTALGLIARCVPSRRAGSSGQAIRSAIRYHCGDCWPGHGNDFQSLQNVAPTAIFEANSRLAARRTSLQQPPAQARAAARFQSRKVEPDAPRSRHPPIGDTTQQRPRRRAFMIRSANFLTGYRLQLGGGLAGVGWVGCELGCERGDPVVELFGFDRFR